MRNQGIRDCTQCGPAAEYYRYKGYSVIITMPKKMSLVRCGTVGTQRSHIDSETAGERSRPARSRSRSREDSE